MIERLLRQGQTNLSIIYIFLEERLSCSKMLLLFAEHGEYFSIQTQISGSQRKFKATGAIDSSTAAPLIVI